MRQILKGSTDKSVELYIIDSTDGTPELGVTFETAGIDLNYRRDGAAVVAITEVTLSALTDAHSDGGFLEIANGRYRLDVPDAAFAAGVSQVSVGGTVTDMIVLPVVIQLVGFDPDDAARLGLTALPNAAADAAGGLPVSDAGGLDLDTKLANTNEVTAARMGALTDWINGGRLDLLLDAIKAITDALPDSGALTTIGADTARLTAERAAVLTDWINGGRLDLLLDAIKAVTDALPDAGALTTIAADAARLTDARAGALTDWIDGGRLDLLIDAIKAITDAHTPQTGDSFVRLGATGSGLTSLAQAAVCTEARLAELDAANLPTDVANVATNVGLVRSKTDNLPADPADDSDIDTQLAAIAVYIDTEIAAIKAKTDNLPADPASETNVNANETKIDAIDTVVDAIKAVTDNLPDAGALSNLDAAITTRATPAQVNEEVLDVMGVDTHAEPGQEAPAATNTWGKKLDYLFKFMRNKLTNDGTTIEVYNDAGAVVDQKSTVSEVAGTVTRGEFGSGP